MAREKPLPPKRSETMSGIELDGCYTAEHVANQSSERIGRPGEYPFTRGIHPTMYRGKPWTMRMFAGFGSPKDTNRRFRFLLDEGQTGLSTAFDMPTLMGFDPDHARALGEVGREGVSVASLDDMLTLFDGIPLDRVTTSMTINGPAIVLLAQYVAAAERQGVSPAQLRGTTQTDILKEFIAQKEWIVPIAPSMRIVRDMMVWTTEHMPLWNTISISGYHIREAGATAVQELAFTLADGLAYAKLGMDAGLDVDAFAPRLSFFFDVHNDFFEEIAKLRAARRMWATYMKERIGAKNPRSWWLRTHCQTAGVSLMAQQPLVNIVRTTMQALAAVLGGTQSLHTNSYDETYALPTEEAATIALRTQQILAHESGISAVADPLGGSHFLEWLTDRMEAEARSIIDRIDAMGGMVKATAEGFPQREIAKSAYRFQQQVDSGERVILGVNRYPSAEEPIPTLKIDPDVEHTQARLAKERKTRRDASLVKRRLDVLRSAASGDDNLFPPVLDAVRDGITLGEICGVFREVFGEFREAAML